MVLFRSGGHDSGLAAIEALIGFAGGYSVRLTNLVASRRDGGNVYVADLFVDCTR